MFASVPFFSQEKKNDLLYILDEDGFSNVGGFDEIIYLINIKRPKGEFGSDSYKFNVPNQVGFEEYKKFKNIRAEIDLDTISYISMDELSHKGTCELHEFFSRIKYKNAYIYSIVKIKKRYYTFPINYKGTEKNLYMLKGG